MIGRRTTGTVTNSGTLSIGGNASTSTIANAVNASFSVAGALTTNGADVSNDGTLSLAARPPGNIGNTGSLTIYGGDHRHADQQRHAGHRRQRQHRRHRQCGATMTVTGGHPRRMSQ
jgi:hypothetical protein